MKIRTIEQLSDYLDKEISWRKMELYALYALATTPQITPNKKNAMLRSIVTLTYAHWEGFIKASGTAYIEFVSQKKLKNEELSSNFLALSMRNIIMDSFQSKKVDDHIKIINFFYNEMDEPSRITYKVSTQNLSYIIFRDIVATLGFDNLYETKEKLITERLLSNRNSIAHGEYIDLDEKDVLQLPHQFIEIMQLFRNQIDNAAILETYKKVVS